MDNLNYIYKVCTDIYDNDVCICSERALYMDSVDYEKLISNAKAMIFERMEEHDVSFVKISVFYSIEGHDDDGLLLTELAVHNTFSNRYGKILKESKRLLIELGKTTPLSYGFDHFVPQGLTLEETSKMLFALDYVFSETTYYSKNGSDENTECNDLFDYELVNAIIFYCAEELKERGLY